jgi:flagellar biosynthetic protein FlhB
MADDSGKTEKPTAKKLRDSRKEGQFARTADAPVWFGLAAGFVMLPKSVSVTSERLQHIFAGLPEVAADPTPAQAFRVLAQVPSAVVMGVLPVATAAGIAALLVVAAQGVHPTSKALKPKFNRMSPKQGIKRMFGTHAVWEAAKALVKVIVIAVVVLLTGRHIIPDLMAAGPLPISVTLERARDGFSAVIWSAVLAGVAIAAADYAYQKRSTGKKLRMSHKDIKDEMKQSEGDPAMKGAIRSRQIAMSRNRMLQAVETADAVLVNPTHIAVAVKYEVGKGAPRVVAKGADAVALKIRERARTARVPVIEDKPLARALYRVCEVGDEIPNELYMAIARILAFVMSMGKPTPTSGPRRAPSATKVPLTLPTKAGLKRRRAKEVRLARGARAAQSTAAAAAKAARDATHRSDAA